MQFELICTLGLVWKRKKGTFKHF